MPGSEAVARPCSALAYDHSAQPRGGVSPQQQLVDRLARKNWHTCRAPAAHECPRCGLPLCSDHLPAPDRRCRVCEQEFVLSCQRGSWAVAGTYVVMVFAAGGVAASLGYRWGLVVAVGALALAPAMSRLGSLKWRRKRFLRERQVRPAMPPARVLPE